MIAITKTNFPEVREELREMLLTAPQVTVERWQGIAANTDTFELRNVDFEIDLAENESLDHWANEIHPNTEWANAHFQERISGHPLNPGKEWANWPFALSAAKFVQTRFNHTYSERLWPKFARRTEDGVMPKRIGGRGYPDKDPRPNYGIAHHYGDLRDLVELLAHEPHTRQAYIPLFFPEDTGKSDGGRKVCSLGYNFLVRENKLHVWYPLRSCDFVRHFSDDCYLTIRLLLWVLDECRKLNPEFWTRVKPGTFAFHATSLHIFRNDKEKLANG